jgi:carboxybiotin decarboxylase
VLLAKLLNRITKEPINPLIGAAGVSAVPMSARVVNQVGMEANPQSALSSCTPWGRTWPG